jgi:hypothetical protein
MPNLDATPARYRITIGGHLDVCRSAWFDGLTIDHDANACTVLTGSVRDQAALYGLLIKLRDLGVPLLAVQRLPSSDSHAPYSF